MLYVYLEAPFAAFRTFTAGWYRPTATFLTPSAAYGLLMNVAGVDTRLSEGAEGHDGKTPATLTRSSLPAVELAIGAAQYQLTCRGPRKLRPDEDVFPRMQSVFQQLHNYPVGTSAKERAADCRGNKYNIAPVRREFLSDLRAVIAVKTDDDTAARIRRGLGSDPPSPQERPRYGVPFLGDNAFLLDRFELLSEPGEVCWYQIVTAADDSGPRERTTRLTFQIDRADLSRSKSALFAPGEPSTAAPPDNAWVALVSLPVV